MPSPYLYAVVGFVVAMVVVGAILGMQVSSLSARVASLENKYNMLMSNYTALQGKYNQLSANYTQLQSSYSQLQQQYAGLENQYSGLQSQYQALNQTYTDLVQNMTYYKPLMNPVIYNWNANASALWLNITNPTNQPTNITIPVTYNPEQPINPILSGVTIPIPPHSTVSIPVLVGLYNSTYGWYVGWQYGYGFSPPLSLNVSFIIAVLNEKLSSYGASGVIYNMTPTTQPALLSDFGFAEYFPSTQYYSSTFLVLSFINPTNNAITITGYSLYSYNGSLLTTCTVSPSITINALTSMQNIDLYSASGPMTSYPSEFILNGAGQSLSIPLTLTCTNNYIFPTNIAQLPYGYVVLNTNVGNITVPLLPPPWS